MSGCGCQANPCSCQTAEPVCAPEPKATKCDLYQPGDENCWVEKGDPSARGICMLNTLNECQVVYILERDDRARADLLKVTSDPALRELALTIPKLPVVEQTDAEQVYLNRNTEPASLPFYSLFRGRLP